MSETTDTPKSGVYGDYSDLLKIYGEQVKNCPKGVAQRVGTRYKKQPTDC